MHARRAYVAREHVVALLVRVRVRATVTVTVTVTVRCPALTRLK